MKDFNLMGFKFHPQLLAKSLANMSRINTPRGELQPADAL